MSKSIRPSHKSARTYIVDGVARQERRGRRDNEQSWPFKVRRTAIFNVTFRKLLC